MIVRRARQFSVTVGVDVGGPAKGFHAVALKNGNYHAKLVALDARVVAAWCEDMSAGAVGIDAPCCWSRTGRQRSAERELAQEKISCFSTPTYERALEHPTRNYDWMMKGQELFAALAARYPLFAGEYDPRRPMSFETFPQAIACALAGSVVSAKKKRQVRRDVLRAQGVELSQLSNIDFIDAALCALAGDYFCRGSIKTYGAATDGFIIVPRTR